MSVYFNHKHACNTDIKRATSQYGSENGYDSDGGINWRPSNAKDGLLNFKMYRNFKDRMNGAAYSVTHSRKSSETENENPYEFRYQHKGNDTIKEEDSYMLDTSNFLDNLVAFQPETAGGKEYR